MELPIENTKKKVFVIGLQRTGTTSLGEALDRSGYSVCGAVGSWWPEIGDNYEQIASILVEKYDAFQDNPWPLVYKNMYYRYPDSKFILSTRDSHSWASSMRSYFEIGFSPFEKWFFNSVSINQLSNDQLITFFENHESKVKSFFAKTKSNFLEFKIGVHGWEELSKFLHFIPPNERFPCVNTKNSCAQVWPLSTKQPDEMELRNQLGLKPL